MICRRAHREPIVIRSIRPNDRFRHGPRVAYDAQWWSTDPAGSREFGILTRVATFNKPVREKKTNGSTAECFRSCLIVQFIPSYQKQHFRTQFQINSTACIYSSRVSDFMRPRTIKCSRSVSYTSAGEEWIFASRLRTYKL